MRLTQHLLAVTSMLALAAASFAQAPAAPPAKPAAPAAPAPPPPPPGIRIIAEAEDFELKGDAAKGWHVMPYRENYFASTFAITFLSRMACLSSPEQIDAKGKPTVATQKVEVPSDGEFTVLARYEQPYNFSVEFTVEVEQNGKTVYSKLYGKLEDPKVWPLNGHQRVAMERFFWGGTDNIVWQHFDAVPLKKGKATIRLVAGPQMDGDKPRANAARRNVDVVCLTNDTAGIARQLGTKYLEFDGWLVQDGDLFVRVTNPKSATAPFAPVIAPNATGQHSPYYIHVRDWTATTVLGAGRLHGSPFISAGPRALAVKPENLAPLLDGAAFGKVIPPEAKLQPGQTSGWVPVGDSLDALNNCIWTIGAPATGLDLEFAIPDGKGGLKSIRKMTITGDTSFEMPGVVNPNDTLRKLLAAQNREPVIRTVPETMEWLAAEVHKFPKMGKVAERFLIYNIGGFGGTPATPAGRDLMAALGDNTALIPGKKRALVAHWRETDTGAIDKHVAQYGGGNAENGWKSLYIVSYGDETHLPPMQPTPEEFAAYLAANKVTGVGDGLFTNDRKNPLFYYSQLCAKDKGGNTYAKATSYYAEHGVLAGANYSPHSNYLVSEIDYIRPFKIGAMSMPWSEDYVWQIPEFSVQVTGYLVSAFRAGAKYHDNPIHMYICPHSPGNTPRSMERSFYTAVAHGAKMVNYFCASPLSVGGTENYIATDDLPMWKAIHDCSHAAGAFEDYVMDGHVRNAKVGLLLSNVDELMTGSVNSTFAMHNNERKAIYYALRHAQIPVDFLSEDDLLDGHADGYKAIYVTQQWVHSKAIKALKAFAEKGGVVVATVGGGFLNEFNQPNPEAGELFGVKEQQIGTDPDLAKYLLDLNKPFLTKQDLPIYKPFDRVAWDTGKQQVKDLGVIVWKQSLKPADGKVVATFGDGSPAGVEKAHGKGRALLLGFLPGQAYLKSGLPMRPADRGSSDNAFTHFIPTEMDATLRNAIVADQLPAEVTPPVRCSVELVESSVIETTTPQARMAVPLVNYSAGPIKALSVTVEGLAAAKKVQSVKQGELKPEFKDGAMTVTLPLDVADMLLIDR
ncbi:MAG: hypothetical protein NTW19_23780 [Planctomycetota bacterium]|nr:hypothetical protein [Planctomycetota bacterium]